ncbi:hypothetical protein AB836_00365 [Rickettsiales bacterium (ex Bugula neritina AB1)]|nr:hypothetical protein AB836_00365 [Rickettsiales bacterium (ex Bugula neritina AB1)]
MLNFEILKKNLHGRIGVLKTNHGNVLTPNFIFCGTKAAIKGVTSWDLNDTQMVLANTFHLLPYSKDIKNFGGLHKFMGISKPLLMDSGGFQIFSLGNGGVVDEIKGIKKKPLNKIKIYETGCEFINNKNQKILLTPELSVQTQVDCGVDLVVAFDECTPSHYDYYDTRSSMRRSHRWELRSYKEFEKIKLSYQGLMGVAQGGIYKDLRDESCNFLKNNGFFGYCIGGSLGKTKEEMYNTVAYTAALLNNGEKKFIHLLGIGETDDIFNMVKYGIDSFDCVHATRIGRHGAALLSYKSEGKDFINLNNKKYKYDQAPIDTSCLCNTCKYYSRSYLYYLLKINEIIVINAIVHHNIFRMNRMMKEIREGIENNTFNIVKKKWCN